MKINYFEARKQVELKKEGEFEFRKIHVTRLDMNKELYKDLIDVCEYEDDHETNYGHGIIYSWDDLHSIETTDFIPFLKLHIRCQMEDNDYTLEDQLIIDLNKLLKILEKYNGYSLILKEEDIKQETSK